MQQEVSLSLQLLQKELQAHLSLMQQQEVSLPLMQQEVSLSLMQQQEVSPSLMQQQEVSLPLMQQKVSLQVLQEDQEVQEA